MLGAVCTERVSAKDAITCAQAGLAIDFQDHHILTCQECHFHGYLRSSTISVAAVHLYSTTVVCNSMTSYAEQLVEAAANLKVC